jgi:hypothetical protein
MRHHAITFVFVIGAALFISIAMDELVNWFGGKK